MKDQYFGDLNDYRKYGLLRAISEGMQLTLGVCWLRTLNDDRRDGEFRRYLQRPDRWRHFDPGLYDALRRLLVGDVQRTVLHAESWGLLPGAYYHHNVLGDDASGRRGYFAEAWSRLREAPLLFLDPDNGLQIPSVGYGTRNSAKYLYWHEVEEGYGRGHSLVLYQHFPRRTRDAFVASTMLELRQRLARSCVKSFRTPNVLFLAAMHPEHARAFQGARALVLDRWKGQIL